MAYHVSIGVMGLNGQVNPEASEALFVILLRPLVDIVAE